MALDSGRTNTRRKEGCPAGRPPTPSPDSQLVCEPGVPECWALADAIRLTNPPQKGRGTDGSLRTWILGRLGAGVSGQGLQH